MAGNNVVINPLNTFSYSQAQQESDVTRGVNTHAIRMLITGALTVAGGAVDGTLQPQGAARLVKTTNVNLDNFLFCEPIAGRDLYNLGFRSVIRSRVATGPTIPGVQAATPFSVLLEIPFSPNILADPYDVFIPAMDVRQLYKHYITFENARSNASSDPGTAAFIAGGDRVVTFDSFTCEVLEVYSVPNGRQPRFAPVIVNDTSDQFTAASTQLQYRLLTSRRVMGHMFRYLTGTADVSGGTAEDGINSLILQASNVRQINDASYAQLKEMERDKFPGVPATDPGALYIDYLDNGRLGVALDPKRMGTNPRYIFNVDAPLVTPGWISVVAQELRVIPGVTLEQTA